MTVDRIEPDFLAGERDQLVQWLDYHRATLMRKCEGLDEAQLKLRAVPPSSLSLLGLVRHMADVERGWFQSCINGEDVPALFYDEQEPDGEFDLVGSADVDADMATYDEQCRRSREIVRGAESLEIVGERRGQVTTLRWVMMHMLEEYARHNGHADLLREYIDGATGE